MPVAEAYCRTCRQAFAAAEAKRNFLGFHETRCPECELAAIAPLSTGYRVAYAVFSVLVVLQLAVLVPDARVELRLKMGSSVLLVLLVGVLVYDAMLRRRDRGPTN